MSVTSSYPQLGPNGGPGILGPWCEWPRREKQPAKTPTKKRIAIGASAAAAAAFAHCVFPQL